MTDFRIMGVGGEVAGGDEIPAKDIPQTLNHGDIPNLSRAEQLTNIKEVFNARLYNVPAETMRWLSLAPALMEYEINGQRTFVYMYLDQENNTLVPIDTGDTDNSITFPNVSETTNTNMVMRARHPSIDKSAEVFLQRSPDEDDNIPHSTITYIYQKEGGPKLIAVHLFDNPKKLEQGVKALSAQPDYTNQSFAKGLDVLSVL